MTSFPKITLFAILMSLIGCSLAMAQTKTPSLFVAPNDGAKPEFRFLVLCDANVSFRVGDLSLVKWPHDRTFFATNQDHQDSSDPRIQHRMVLSQVRKAHRSFTCRSYEF